MTTAAARDAVRETHAPRQDPTPIVVFGDDWGRHVSTTQHIFRRIVGERPVLWLNAINHRTPKLSLYDAKRAVNKVAGMLRRDAAAPVAAPARVEASERRPTRVVPPRVLPWHRFGPARALNRRSLLGDLRGALEEIAPGRRPVLLTATPAIPDVVRDLDAIARIYFCIDDYGELQGVDKDMVVPLERETLQRVDAVIATARSLVSSKVAHTGRGYYLPQGVNYDHFATPRAVPPELAALPRPIVGFAGDLSLRCDVALLERVARAVPEGSLVFVGPVNLDVSRLTALPNVHVLGNRPYADLPAYVQSFDVALIPYILNDWTRAVDPLKLLEYLAAGAPVVTTALPEAYKYAEVVSIAERDDAFVSAVRAAADRGAASGRDRRQALAAAHTWERRTDTFRDYLREICDSAGRGTFV